MICESICKRIAVSSHSYVSVHVFGVVVPYQSCISNRYPAISFQLFPLATTESFSQNLNYIPAKVPILRFEHPENNIEVDLNYNNCVGIRNSHLLYLYTLLDWRLQPLALIVKLWAQHHDINNAKDLTISSYSLILMVINYLQCGVQPPILPSLQAAYPEQFVIFIHLKHEAELLSGQL